MGTAKGSVAETCPTNAGSMGLLSRWRAVCKTLSDSDRTGILRRDGPVISFDMEALVRCEERIRRRKSQGTSTELGAQSKTASSTCASRQSNRALRRKKEQVAREHTKEQQLVTRLLEGQLNPQDGNARGQTVTFSSLHSWRHGGRVNAEFEDDKNTQEKLQESGVDSRFTGIVVDSSNGKKKKEKRNKKLARVESDGILLVVPVMINGKMFFALIDSGATRCFITQKCCTIAGLSCVPCDTFLELGNGTMALSHGKV